MLSRLSPAYEYITSRLGHEPPRRFGLFEATKYLRHGSFDWIARHLMILSELERYRNRVGMERLRVLDFGGADGSLARAIRLYNIEDHYDVVLADVDADAATAATRQPPLSEILVISNRPPMPLADRAVDAVISSDVFEHIPREVRQSWADELLRIGPRLQVHTVPCDQPELGYVSVAIDQAFSNWHIGRFGRPERWTAEHLALGPPTATELSEMFPGAVIGGTVNAGVWQQIMRGDFSTSSRWGQLRNAVWHPLLYRLVGSRSPYKGCLVVRVEDESAAPVSGIE